ncbi:PREDICTED: peptidyl-prolyl cis-trans isomerase-like 2 [Amphimedon queenslandica]|uniref:RING-type E3 ubiquitin-protein ligase PPIL2 n=1 Tax=Amphimedon queenslandica TaxID=400682 RepID=A0A1X7V9V1_AMPQE|nr:PREDICTED: peptidyl-prolyl cis-trans isomerase-like 2 [Amphimedon queenslandica]|eukprot:XP_019850074.1 PREDICTED: peptidyl-prolyl cis-trans isomerase-like 2 [Amphimedon queenslandica]
MGKKQHQKDKLYLTCTEWSTIYGGKKAAAAARGGKSEFKRLPFSCCSLSLQPFEHPLCTPEGVVFDLMNIVPYLKKYGHSPVTGKPMDAKSLTKLKFHKNNEGDYHCPITLKVFNENTHIVAIKTSGNVYSYDAIERLNISTKHFRDLIDDTPFKRSDILTIQDPKALDKFDISNFYHVQNNLLVDEEEIERAKKDPTYCLRVINPEAKAALEGLYQEYKAPEKKEKTKEKLTARNAAHYSTGAVAQSFTSTVAEVATYNEADILSQDVVRYSRVKKKGYVRLHTNMGDLNLELHCDLVPKTCENFILLCKKGYYDDTIFHRSIRHFMIQGGDPTGTGRGGESAWGKPFDDEFKPQLTHSERGILSMANSGPNTNGSQFFITFKSCHHLDRKHSVFGKLVGGMDVLLKLERVRTDKDRPMEEIKVTSASVFVDPFEEVDLQLKEEDEKEKVEALESKKKKKKDDSTQPTVYRKGIGKYISPKTIKGTQAAPDPPSSSLAGSKRTSSSTLSSSSVSEASSSKRTPSSSFPSTKTKSKGFGDFSSW